MLPAPVPHRARSAPRRPEAVSGALVRGVGGGQACREREGFEAGGRGVARIVAHAQPGTHA